MLIIQRMHKIHYWHTCQIYRFRYINVPKQYFVLVIELYFPHHNKDHRANYDNTLERQKIGPKLNFFFLDSARNVLDSCRHIFWSYFINYHFL